MHSHAGAWERDKLAIWLAENKIEIVLLIALLGLVMVVGLLNSGPLAVMLSIVLPVATWLLILL